MNNNTVEDAVVVVKGREQVPFFTSRSGEYWKLLLPGSYSLLVSSGVTSSLLCFLLSIVSLWCHCYMVVMPIFLLCNYVIVIIIVISVFWQCHYLVMMICLLCSFFL